MPRLGLRFLLPCALLPLLLASGWTSVASPAVNTPRVHAIVGARIVTAPGQVIPRGTLVIRDGLIEAVGAKVQPPRDARIWPGDSLTVYAGLIEAYLPVEAEKPVDSGRAAGRPGAPPASTEARKGPLHPLEVVRPETRAADLVPLPKEALEPLRAAGFTAAAVAPRSGVLRGQSALVHLLEADPNRMVVRSSVAQIVALEPVPRRSGYPGSLMGCVAVARQALSDARWYGDVRAAYSRTSRGRERPPVNKAWEALVPAARGEQPVLFLCSDMLEVMRAGALARELGVQGQALGAGDEYKRLAEVKATGLPLIIPVNFPEAPDVADPADALEVSTAELRHWYYAPENPGALARAGITLALTTSGLKDVRSFREKVRAAIDRGLSAEQALAGVTVVPARLLGIEALLGTIEPGKIANLTVTSGDLFSEKGKVRELWVDGDRVELEVGEAKLEGSWDLSVALEHETAKGRLIVDVEPDTMVRFVAQGDTVQATAVEIEPQRLRFGLSSPKLARGETLAFDLELRYDRLTGDATSAAGTRYPAWADKIPEPKEGSAGEKGRQAEKGGERATRGSKGEAGSAPARAAADTARIVTPRVPGDPEAWRAQRPEQPRLLLVKNATLWTCGPRGKLVGADLLVRSGKIAAVGKGLSAPGAVLVDASGKHVIPGILDCHSHAAILGDVNECTNNVTAEVRIQDVINSESQNIYRQLAGGVTVMHLLHGSCNSIGGQCAVIKCRWGEPPERLVFAEAPPTIKFALGENPKQSNWDERPAVARYPASRAGVEQSIREAFMAARDYRREWEEYRAGKRKGKLPPRRDFQLECLNEILNGKRVVHSHSYRQDEILMLIRLADRFGFRVGTFQHVLEGYKVADEMAAHGSGGSTFSDWWAYKYEVIDAIPYNGYLMWDRGVNVSYNSDSDELARRLNTEAAKAVKYGGVPEEEALKFVTLNPAWQLGVDHLVGSLEPGKAADFSIWNGSPLSPSSACQQTWIEGRKYFDREADLAGRAALERERQQLISRAKGEKKRKGGPPGDGERRWPPPYLESRGDEGKACGTCEQTTASEGVGR